MFCKKCGKKNPEGSKFCQHCGIHFGEQTPANINPYGGDSVHGYVTVDDPPYPYVISIWKLIVICVFTFGFYEVYWFYRQWKSFNTANNLKHGSFALWVYSLFAPLSSYSLFKHISNNVKKANYGKGLEAGGLAIIYFFLARIWLGFLPLIPVQNKINLYWEKKYHKRLVRSNFGVWNWIVIITSALLVFYVIFSEDTSTDTPPSTSTNPSVVANYNQEEIVSSVVNIFCPSIIEGEEGTGGSGTIITDDGVILTNSHIIPQDEEYINVDERGCLVILPNSTTGQPEEMYWATPIVLPEISDTYDLAYLSIYGVYYDEETQENMGTYPRTFPAFDDSNRCVDENIKLGEKVTIFGYPSLSGGYFLTVTDGLVSSFPGEGLIVTSAKISEGNSGGLAVDENGCMLGIPSMISYDETESLGVIISSDLIYEFSNEVLKYLEQ